MNKKTKITIISTLVICILVSILYMNTFVGNEIEGILGNSESDDLIEINPEKEQEDESEETNSDDLLVSNPKDQTENDDFRIINPDYISFEGDDVVIVDDLSLPLKNPEKYVDKIVFDKNLRIRFGENIFIDPNNPREKAEDRDNDLLKDELEGELANGFKPYFRFDSYEKYRQPFEPITLFQVRPNGYTGLGYNGVYEILIRWTFLFRYDGGYGPGAYEGEDSHIGDNDVAIYKLISHDGKTWQLVKVILSDWNDDPICWPDNTELELVPDKNGHNPVIYMSAGKHHMYLDTSYDHKDSHYSNVPFWDDMDDDVNGEGAAFISNVKTIFDDGRFNNVGEPEAMLDREIPNNLKTNHGGYFVTDLSKYFPGENAWGSNNFMDSNVCGPNKELWFGPPYHSEYRYWTESANYKISVKTGDIKDAGTNANVFITLYGHGSQLFEGSTGEIYLDDEDRDDFERGNIDTFEVKAQKIDTIEYMRIRQDTSEPKDGWYIDYIKIENEDTGQQWNIKVNRWLALDENDGKVDIILNV